MKKFKASVVLLSSLLISQLAVPVSAYAMSDEVSNDTELISGYNFDYNDLDETKFEAVSDKIVEITNPDGTIDVLERRDDGVYLNGDFYMGLQGNSLAGTSTFRSAPNLNQWYYVGSANGTAEGAANANGLAHSIIALLLSFGWNPLATAYSIGAIIISMISPAAPGAYYRTSLYVHPQNRQLKTVTSYYRNSNYTGYVTTVTKYSNF